MPVGRDRRVLPGRRSRPGPAQPAADTIWRVDPLAGAPAVPSGHTTVRALLPLLFALAMVAGLAGCGTTPSRTISPTSASSQIAQQLQLAYHLPGVVVSCPRSVAARPGTTFVCSATLFQQTVAVDGRVTDSNGGFTARLASPVVMLATLAEQLARQISARSGQRPTVTCPPPPGSTGSPLRVAPVRSRFDCSAVFAGQAPRTVTVTIVDAKGDFAFDLAPAPAG